MHSVEKIGGLQHVSKTTEFVLNYFVLMQEVATVFLIDQLLKDLDVETER